MKVGIWLDADYAPEEGGGFSYYDKLVKALDNYSFGSSIEICFVTESQSMELRMNHPVYRLAYKFRISMWDRIRKHLPFNQVFKQDLAHRAFVKKQTIYRSILEQNDIDVIYYLRQGECHVKEFPFIATNWDIGHCSTYAFPELINDGQFEQRNNFYTRVLPQALFVLAESEAGKKELIRYTCISEDKIKVVPIFAGNCVDDTFTTDKQLEVLKEYNLEPHKYFFYPAQFWAHKNHSCLIKAFEMFHKSNPDYKLVLTGSDKGNLSYIKYLVDQLNLSKAIVFPGFVSTAVINTFYKQSTSLIMASYFGPTNMPPIEAMQLGCPIICTDISGHKEILGDAAIYFQPTDVHELANCMSQMDKQRDKYVQLIQAQQKISKFTVEIALSNIEDVFSQLLPIRSTWK